MAVGDTANILFKIRADGDQAQSELRNLIGQTSGLGSEFTALAGPAGIATAVVASVASAALTAAAGIFRLAQASAEYGSEIFDATEKTGLAAETISSIKIAADQSGTSLEAVTAGFSKFVKQIGAARDGSTQAFNTLKALGVTSTDLDTALSQVLSTIAKYDSGVDQMTAAQKAFGKSGVELLPFIRSFDGDLPSLIAKCKELGLTLTDEDAKAADEFGDTLDTLSAQAAATGRAFVGPLMKDITAAMTDISGALAKNQDAVKDWGEEVATTLRGLKNVSQDVYEFAQTDAGRALSLLLFGQVMAVGSIKGIAQSAAGPPPPLGTPMPHMIPKSDYDPMNPNKKGPLRYEDTEEFKKEAEKRAKEREAAFQKELTARSRQNALMLQGERAAFTANQQAWEQAFIEGKETREKFQDISLQNLAGYQRNVQQLLANALKIDATGKTGTELENLRIEYRNSIAALGREVAKEREDIEKTITDTVKKQADERKQILEDEARNAIAVAAARSARRVEEIRGGVESGTISTRGGLIAIQEEEQRLLKTRIILTTDLNEKTLLNIELQTALLRAKRELAAFDKQEAERQRAFWADELERYNRVLDAIEEQMRLEDEAAEKQRVKDAAQKREDDRSLINRSLGEAGGFGNPSTIDDLGRVKTNADFIKEVYRDMQSTSAQAIGSMIQDLGNLAINWILTGKFSAKAALQMAAGVLMGVGLQAAVKGIFELAEAAAAAARYDFRSAALHKAAAAIYFKTAAVAGAIGAGLGVASRAFGEESGAATGGGSGGPTSNSSDRDPNSFTSGPRPYSWMREEFQANRLVNAAVVETLEGFRQDFRRTTAADVIMSAEDAVFDSVQNRFANDPRATDRQMRNTGFV